MITDLLEYWTAQGVEFAVVGDDLCYEAPADVDIDAMLAALRPRKEAIVKHLRGLAVPCSCGDSIGYRLNGRVTCRTCSPKPDEATKVVFNNETHEWDDFEAAKAEARAKLNAKDGPA